MPSIARLQRAACVRGGLRAALGGAVTLIVILAGAQVAQAGVTASSITAPSGPVFTLNDTTLSASPVAFTVQGTFTGSTTARLAIDCYYADGSHQTVAENVEGSDGAFSVAVSSSALLGGAPCVLRAVPVEDYASYPPGSESPFQGPMLAPSELYVSTLGEASFDYELTATTPAQEHEFSSAGSCGLGDSPPFLPGSTAAAESGFDCDGALYAEEPLEAQQSSRSEVQLDGFNAYGPYAAEHLLGPEPGAPSLSISREFDPATGLVVIHETDPMAVCAPEPAVFPPTASSCSSLVPAGVSLVRTWQTEDSGAVVSLTDNWMSTDGASHPLAVLYDNRMQSAGGGSAGFLFPASSAFSDFATGSTVTLPPGPGSIYYAEDRATPTGGDGQNPFAALSYDIAPSGPVTFTGSDVAGGDTSSFVMPYRRTIPAGGSFTLRMSFAQDLALTEAQEQAGEAVASYSPTLMITAPSDGETLSSPTVTLSGEVSYAHELSSLTVDGASVQIGAGGTWSAPVTVTAGANTITVTAAGEEGVSTTRLLSVTYSPATPPSETPPGETTPPSETPPAEAPPPSETPPAKTPPVAEIPPADPLLPEAPQELEVIGGGSGTARTITEASGTTGVSTVQIAPAPRATLLGAPTASAGAVSYEVTCVGAPGESCTIQSSLEVLTPGSHAGARARNTTTRSPRAHRILLGSASTVLATGQRTKVTVRVGPGMARSLHGESPQVLLSITMPAGASKTVAVRRLSATLLSRTSPRRR